MQMSVYDKVTAFLSDADEQTLSKVADYVNAELTARRRAENGSDEQKNVTDENVFHYPDEDETQKTVDAMPDELPQVDDRMSESSNLTDTTRGA